LADLLMRKDGCWGCGDEGESGDAWVLVSTSASMESNKDLLMRSSSVLCEGDTGGEGRLLDASVGQRVGVAATTGCDG